MNIDKRISEELENESSQIDEILNDKQTLSDLLLGSYRSGLGRWTVAVSIVTFVVSALMVWSGYRFFSADNQETVLFWGFCLLIALVCQIALKQWVWMEMNRSSLHREIKRLEIAVARLAADNEVG